MRVQKLTATTQNLSSIFDDVREDAFDILLIEDNSSDAYLIKKTLGRMQLTPDPIFHVTIVPRMLDALTLLESDIFDAAILDLNLLDTKGIESLIWLNSAVSAYTPIIVYSAGVNEEEIEEAALCGAFCCMSKNQATTGELKQIVQKAIGFKPY